MTARAAELRAIVAAKQFSKEVAGRVPSKLPIALFEAAADLVDASKCVRRL
jgi:hypothetical protein